MDKQKDWKCDFDNCKNTAKWYRIVKHTPVKVCTKHEAQMCRENMGKCIRLSQLSRDEMHILEEKDNKFNFRCPNCRIQRSVPCNEILEDNIQVRCPKCKVLMFKI
jgi:hypothetical protein